MRPEDVKLPLKLKAKALTLAIKERPGFPMYVAVFGSLFSLGSYMSSKMPVLIPSSWIMDAMAGFGLSVLILVLAVAPFVIAAIIWFDDDDGAKDELNRFIQEYKEAKLPFQKQELENVDKVLLE